MYLCCLAYAAIEEVMLHLPVADDTFCDEALSLCKNHSRVAVRKKTMTQKLIIIN